VITSALTAGWLAVTYGAAASGRLSFLPAGEYPGDLASAASE
jgi:hypothetical protein